jgi:Putative peptidoglycan binding domain
MNRLLTSSRIRVGAIGAVVAIAIAIALSASGAFGGGEPGEAASTSGVASSFASVRRGPLSSQVQQSGTVTYAAERDGSSFKVINQLQGTVTRIPDAGQIVNCGEELFRISNNPVALLCGLTPAYRTLSQGMSGLDVRALNRNLVRLHYATSAELDPSSKYFGAATASALKKLQDALNMSETGILELGHWVFLKGPVRIAKTLVPLGSPARPGMSIADATSTEREVKVEISPSEQSNLEIGDRVEITLPNNRVTTGKITRIGAVATSDGDAQAGSGDSGGDEAKLPVYVTLDRPKVAGNLDQAVVQVRITTDRVKSALIVPVTALLASAGGGYSVEVVGQDGGHKLVPVTLGLFDDAGGSVQVRSSRLKVGARVVVPQT